MRIPTRVHLERAELCRGPGDAMGEPDFSESHKAYLKLARLEGYLASGVGR